MSSKSLTVKDLAEKYGVSAKLIAAELVRQGVEVNKAEKTKIPEDMTDLIESFFDDLYGQQDEEALLPKGGKRSNGPKKGSSRREEMAFKDNSPKGNHNHSVQEQAVAAEGNTITLSSPIVVLSAASPTKSLPTSLSWANCQASTRPFPMPMPKRFAPLPDLNWLSAHLRSRLLRNPPPSRPANLTNPSWLPVPPSSPLWDTLTTAKPLCRTRSVTPTLPPVKQAPLPSTSVLQLWNLRVNTLPLSTPPDTRHSPVCAPAVPILPISLFLQFPQSKVSNPRPLKL